MAGENGHDWNLKFEMASENGQAAVHLDFSLPAGWMQQALEIARAAADGNLPDGDFARVIRDKLGLKQPEK